MKRRKLEQIESFDLKKNAMEAIEESLYWHTVGIVSDRGTGFGTAIALRFRNHPILLTANHVIRNTSDSDLRFFFRPTGTLRRADWWQTSQVVSNLQPAQKIEIFHRFSNRNADLAALIVSPTLEGATNIRFYDIHKQLKVPNTIRTVAAIGLPADTISNIGPGAQAVAASAIWGNIERRKGWRPADYDARRSLLLKFLPAQLGRHPGGFSGAGVWHHEPTPKPKLWTPNLGLAGLVTDYYPKHQTLLITRVERIMMFLRAITGK